MDLKNGCASERVSFANCEEGWLIVSIKDKTKGIYPVERIDYSQGWEACM